MTETIEWSCEWNTYWSIDTQEKLYDWLQKSNKLLCLLICLDYLNDKKTLVDGQKVNKLLSKKNVKYDFNAYKGKNSSVLLKKR